MKDLPFYAIYAYIEATKADYPAAGLLAHYHDGAMAALNRLKRRIEKIEQLNQDGTPAPPEPFNRTDA